MAYSFQTFSVLEVLGASKMNQIEVNIRDHEHGVSSVSSDFTTIRGRTTGNFNWGWDGATAASWAVIGRTNSVAGAGGTAFTTSESLPMASSEGFIGYSGLVLAPGRWGNATTVDDHRVMYIAGSQRNLAGHAATLAFANWGFFTGTGSGAGGLQNATARGDAVKFRWVLSDQGGEFTQRLSLHTRSATATDTEALRVSSAGEAHFLDRLTITADAAAALDMWGRSADGVSAIRFLTNNGVTLQTSVYNSGNDLVVGTGSSNLTQDVVVNTASVVNYHQRSGAPTTASPYHFVGGTDANVGQRHVAKGTSAIDFESAGGSYVNFRIRGEVVSVVNRFLAFGKAAGAHPEFRADGSDTNPGVIVSSKGTGSVYLYSGEGARIIVRAADAASSVNNWILTPGATGEQTRATNEGTDTNIGQNFGIKGTGVFDIRTGGNSDLQFKVTAVASAVNNHRLYGAATGSDPTVDTVDGSDTNIGYIVKLKGTTIDDTQFKVTNGSGTVILRADQATGTVANNHLFRAAITGNQVTHAAEGTDSNINNNLDSKGTGTVMANSSTVATAANTMTFTNKSISGASNTITNIAQGALKTTSGEVSTTNTTETLLTLPGGSYGFYPTTKDTASGGHAMILNAAGAHTAYATYITMRTDAGTVSATQQYIQASPPYNLGNGDIPLFVFALMTLTGEIKATYIAPEPPWAYNGPTDIRAETYRNGKSYQRCRYLEGVPFKIALEDPLIKQRWLAGEVPIQMVEREITHEIKNQDMPLIPHPFLSNSLTGLTVVLLDPLSLLIDRLLHFLENGGAGEVGNIIRANQLVIGNVPLTCNAPTGVMPVACSWKLN